MNPSLDKAQTVIEASLAAREGHPFTEAQLRRLLAEHREDWGLDTSISPPGFIAFLLERTGLRAIDLRSEHYGRIVRYVLGQYSPYVVALSLRPRSYLSHGTAVSLHGLNEQLPKIIYVNREQSAKPSPGKLSQERLRMAFTHHQRMSSYIYQMETFRVVLLSGKQTGDLGVIGFLGPHEEALRVTGIPRTLIDIVVRPAYAGGILQVLDAYRGARGKVNAEDIVRTLRSLKYVYPYHQSIGFLMKHAGYPREEYAKLREFEIKYDFYLIHGMKQPKYDSQWRLFFPEGI